MKKFNVTYSLQGEIEIEAKDKIEAIELVEAICENDMVDLKLIGGLNSSIVGDTEEAL